MPRRLSKIISSVKEKDKNTDKNNGWEGALAEAKGQLFQANLRRNQLREAIGIIEKKIEDGEPWPGVTEDGRQR
jgi:hypothetical protein